MTRRASASDTPAPDLRAKATEAGARAGGIDPVAVEAARAVVRARGARYLDSLQADIAALEAELAVVAARGNAAALAAIARRARAMRAHGTTYGYGLVTRLASSLYDFCGSATGSEDDIEVIEMHIQALKAVAGGRMTGDGALAGRDLVHAVEEAVHATAGARG